MSRGDLSLSKLTVVSVPVLSEQIIETAPRVSTVLSDLHKILLVRIMFALMVILDVRAIGRPSGIKATATDTQSTIKVGTSIHSGYTFLSQEALYKCISEQT